MSSFGHLFRVTTFGESHCHGVGCIVDGVPPRMCLSASDIQIQLDRRRPGQSKLTTQRSEKDQAIILSGTENDITLGTPIGILVRNEDQRPGDYGGSMVDVPRPSHADYTYQAKYGVRASSGGGRASARETIGRVAAGVIADKFLREKFGVEIIAYVSSVSDVSCSREWEEREDLSREVVDRTLVRCPEPSISALMQSRIESALSAHDSLGGVITCVVRGCPAGLGEPTFDKLEATLAHAMLSIPSTKGFEIGSGFEGTKMRGSEHNDRFVTAHTHGASSPSSAAQSSPTPSPPPTNPASGVAAAVSGSACSPSALPSGHLPNSHAHALRTVTNRSGGIQGGISNGAPIVFRVAFKPPATIGIAQSTANFDGVDSVLESKGRHDPCVLPRAIPIVEAMTALVIADAALIQLSREAAASHYGVMGKVQPRASKLTAQFNEAPSTSAPAHSSASAGAGSKV